MVPKAEWRKGAREVGPGKRDPRLPPFCLSVPGRRRRSFREFCAVLDDSDGAGRAGGRQPGSWNNSIPPGHAPPRDRSEYGSECSVANVGKQCVKDATRGRGRACMGMRQ